MKNDVRGLEARPHRCARFRIERRAGPWRAAGKFRERDVERVAVCIECARDRAGRFRKLVAVEREAALMGGPGVESPALRDLARRLESLLQGRERVRAGALVRRLGGVRREFDLEALAEAVPMRLEYRSRGGALQLEALRFLDPARLAEFARPGAAERREQAVAAAREQTARVIDPEARAIADLLTDEAAARGLDERVLRALAGLALLVESGEPKTSRVFSTEVLGDSKALRRIRARLERLVGPLARLGIRDDGGLTLVGGCGLLGSPGAAIDLARYRCLGLAMRDVLALREVRMPAGGLLVVENLTPFQACAEKLEDRGDVLLLWSGGFPSRGVAHMVQLAAGAGGRIRVWCDLDLAGVRIARRIHHLSRGLAEPVLMGPDVLSAAPVRCPLGAAARARIARDLELHPQALLADTLRAVLEQEVWVEQEGLLDRLPDVLGPHPHERDRR